MLTLQQLKDMEPDTIFEWGNQFDVPQNKLWHDFSDMFQPGEYDEETDALRWVAIRGGIHDWAIYVGPDKWGNAEVARMGNKVHDRETIKWLVPCDNEALEMYRD